MKSAHQAELIYGLHKAQHRNYGGYKDEDGNYHERYHTNGTKKLGLDGEVEQETSYKYTPTWGGNSTHDAYDRAYGTPKPE